MSVRNYNLLKLKLKWIIKDQNGINKERALEVSKEIHINIPFIT